MKIGIVTNLDKRNYGSVLQAYALKTKISELGGECFFIDFTPGFKERLIRRVKNIFSPYRQNYSLRTKWELKKAKKFYWLKDQKLRNFCRNNFNIHEITNFKDAERQADQYNLLLAGSDQIWNPIAGLLSPFTLLSFANKNKQIKASYAASLGVEQLNKKDIKIFSQYLIDFKNISVRERTAVKILKECVPQKQIRVDLDPSLLFDIFFWKKKVIQSNYENEPYIFVYMLRPDSLTIELAKKLSDKTTLKIKVCSNRIFNEHKMENITEAGIEDFLSLIYHSDYFITNSFHGSVFAVIFHKSFLSVAISRTGSRVRDFLVDLGLDEKIVTCENELDRIFKKIPWDKVDEIVNQKRNESIDYIRKLIEGIR